MSFASLRTRPSTWARSPTRLPSYLVYLRSTSLVTHEPWYQPQCRTQVPMKTSRSRWAKAAQSGARSAPAISMASCGDTHSSASTKYTQSCRSTGSRSANSRCAENPGQGCVTTSAPSARASGTVASVEPESTTTTWSAHPSDLRHRPMFGSSLSASTTALTWTPRAGGLSPAR
jgi:hypothetical protein